MAFKIMGKINNHSKYMKDVTETLHPVLSSFIILLVSRGALSVCIHLHQECIAPEEDTGVTDDWQLPCDCREQNRGPLQEQPLLSAATKLNFKRTHRTISHKETEIGAKCF